MDPTRIRWSGVFCAVMLAVAMAGTAATCRAGAPAGDDDDDDDEKKTCVLSWVPKGSLSAEDRKLARSYLKDVRDDLKPAPASVSVAARTTRMWTPACAASARPVPKKLAEQLSRPSAGTSRYLFDRALVVVDTASGRIIDRVEAGR